MRRYVKLANDPTFYLVEEGMLARPVGSPAEMYSIGLLPVEVVSPVELARLREPPAPAESDEGDEGDDQEDE